MSYEWLDPIRRNPAATIGWLGFLTLCLLALANRPVFDPLLFGPGYYALYVLGRAGRSDDQHLLHNRAILAAIFVLFGVLTQVAHRVRLSEMTREITMECSVARRLGGEAQSDICDNILGVVSRYDYSGS
jgi:hypothetical protein